MSHDGVPSQLSDEFNEAFEELTAARVAYEEDPRDPSRIDRLGAARTRLDVARAAIDEERRSLGLEPLPKPEPPPSKIDGEPMKLWQSIQPEF